MKEITLNKGQIAIVDDEDFPLVSKYKWHLDSVGYASARLPRKESGTSIRMHRLLIKINAGEVSDHINGNRLDNRKANLRSATRSLNMINRKANDNVTGWRGVWQSKNSTTAWQFNIGKNYRRYTKGGFSSPRMAALAYNEAALKLFGPSFRFFNQVFHSGEEQ